MALEAERIQTLANDLERHFGDAPQVAVVLGSGWAEGGLPRLENPQVVAVTELLSRTQGGVDVPGCRVELRGAKLVFLQRRGSRR